MTTFAPQAAPGRWISAAELAKESGLRPDLIVRFLPADERGLTPLYSAAQIPLAKFVKQLTDINTPPSAIDVAVRDLVDPAGAQVRANEASSRSGPLGGLRKPALTGIIVGLMALALIGGWILGGLGSSGNTGTSVKSAPVTITAEAPPPAAATVPAAPDRVCSEWAGIGKAYMAKREAWVDTDPNLPAAQWSSQQRALTDAVIPTMKDEAEALRGLAERASSPELRMLLQLRAAYEAQFAERLPNYVPADHTLWTAAIDLANAVDSYCTPVAQR